MGATSAARRWPVVTLLFLAVLINYVDRGNLSIAAVPLMEDFGLAPVSMGTLLSAFFWTYAALQIPMGWVVDRYDLRWTYAGALLIWSFASAAVGLATSFAQIFALRLLLGAGEAMAYPASLTYIRRNFPEDKRGLPTAVFLSGVMVGPAVGAFLAGALLEVTGWRQLFIYTGLGGCLWLIPWLILVPSGRPRSVAAESEKVGRRRTAWRRLLRHPTFWGITSGMFCYSYYWYFCLTWIPSYLVLEYDLSFLKMGTYTALPLLGMAMVSLLSGRVADRMIARGGRAIPVRRNFVCTGFVLGGSGLALLVAPTAEAALVVLFCSLVGLGVTSANFWALTQALAPRSVVGRVVGYQNTISNIAGLCAPILTGYLVGGQGSFRTAIWIAGLCPFLAALAYGLLIRENVREAF